MQEIRNKKEDVSDKDFIKNQVILAIRKYKSSVWDEFFISFETKDGYLIGFTRLLLWKDFAEFEWLGPNTAIIRELHVYWLQAKIWKKWPSQHRGFGKALMKVAEKLAQQAGYKKLSVISWVGVRWFYEKIGYKLEGTYMTKDFNK